MVKIRKLNALNSAQAEDKNSLVVFSSYQLYEITATAIQE